MISAQQLLDILEQKDLLPGELLRKLRQRVAQSEKSVAATALARQLIQLGHLTPALAERLLATAPAEGAGEPSAVAEEKGPVPHMPAEEDELGLAPLEEETKKPGKPGAAPAQKKEEVEDLGLAPLEEDQGKRPSGPAPLGRKKEQKESGLIPLDDKEAKKGPEPATRGGKKAKPESELIPLGRQEGPDEPGLIILDDEAAATPGPAPVKDKPAAKTPAPKAREDKPAQPSGKTPARPADQPAARKPAKGPVQSSQPPAGPAAGSLLEEELTPLSGLAAAPLDDLMASSPLDAAAGAALAPVVSRKRGLFGLFARRRPTVKKGNVWDSPLLLVGGGTLLVLLILGGALFLALNRESGDKMLDPANEDYDNGSYTQAIFKYDRFLESYPNHPGASRARVRRGLAQMRQATEGTTNWPKALETAKQVLEEIAPEPEFKEAHAELASLLPAIAEGLAGQARKSPGAALVEQAHETLALAEKYVPKSLQSAYRARLPDIQASLALTARDLARDAELEKAIGVMQSALKEGKTAEAYRVRYALLKQYPDLLSSAKLAAVVLEVSRAQQSAVKSVDKQQAAETADPPGPLTADVLLTRQTVVQPVAGAEGRVVFALGQGVVYGLDATSGKLLWRRLAGANANPRATRFAPLPLSGAAGADVLLADATGHQVQRVEAATGRLRWRHPVGQPFDAHPVLAKDCVLVATAAEGAGRLVKIDLESGSSRGYVELPQPVRVTPAIDARRDRVYLVAEHSNLFVLSLADGRCQEVAYLGHESGSITTAPILVSRYLIVADNNKLEKSTLRVFSIEAEGGGPAFRPLQQIEMVGHVDTPPLLEDRRLAVVTDRGAIYVFELSGTNAEKPLGQVADREAVGRQDLVRFPLLDGGQFWVAGDRLARFDIQGARGRLSPKGVDNDDEGAVFVQPLVTVGQTLFHARYEVGLPGLLVSALDMEAGRRLWQTQVAAGLAAEPVVDSQAATVTAVTAAGTLFRVPVSAFQGPSVAGPPLAFPEDEKPGETRRPVTSAIRLIEDRMVLSAGEGSSRLFVFDPKREDKKLLTWESPGRLSCDPIAFPGGLLAPCAEGQVHLLDSRTGAAVVEPFQPPLTPGVQTAWKRPALVGDQGKEKEFVIADGRSRVFRVGIEEKPKPHLKALASLEVPEPIVSPVAVLGNAAYAVDRAGTLVGFALPTLARTDVASLTGRCVWGPTRVGDRVLLATDAGQLLLVDGAQKIIGRLPLPYGPLAGTPLAVDDGYLLASTAGVVWRVRVPATDGEVEVSRIDTGRPLGTGPVLLGKQLLLGGHDGSLIQVPLPEAKQPEKKPAKEPEKAPEKKPDR
jgi:outer membrane protein assembly factor BamB/tetratricopeptide (TPR) repeat protein